MDNIKEKLKQVAKNPITDSIENEAIKYIEHLEQKVSQLEVLVKQNPNSVEFMDAFDQGFMAALEDMSNDLEKYIERSRKRVSDYRIKTKNMPTGIAQDQKTQTGDDVYSRK